MRRFAQLPTSLLLVSTTTLLPNYAMASGGSEFAAAIAIGDCKVAADLVAPRELKAPEHLALADCATRTKDPEGAKRHLAQIKEDKALAPWRAALEIRLILADYTHDALLREDEARAVIELADSLSLPGQAGQHVEMASHRAMVSIGEGLTVRPQLRAMLNGEHAAEARYWLARAAELRDDREPALSTYRSTWVKNVTSPWAASAAARLDAMNAPVPDTSTDAGRELVRQRATALGKAYRSQEALQLWLLLEKAQPQQSKDWQLHMAHACFAARDYLCAITRYAEVGSPNLNVPGRDHTVFQHALATSRTGDYTKAATHYTAIFETQPGAKQADQASFKIGYLDLDAGRWAAAVEGFDAHRQRYPSSRYTTETRWFKGWAQWRAGGQADAAIETWAPIIKTGNARYAPQAHYWTAFHLNTDDAMREVLDRHPTSGAAWFARLRLGHPAPSLAAMESAPQSNDASVFLTLMDVGLLSFAAAEYSAGTQRTHAEQAHDWLALGDAKRAQRVIPGGCRGNIGTNENRHACWPRLHANIVEKIATDVGLPALLPYAIMKTESGFRPEVTSPAGARGLMQLMPEVGKRLHENLYETLPYNADNLYLGPYNALLGTSELARLYRHYLPRGKNEAIPLTIAAYNAGQAAVDKWLAAWEGPLDIDVFAASISYTETRRYVQKVLGYLSAYEHAWSAESVDVETPGR